MTVGSVEGNPTFKSSISSSSDSFLVLSECCWDREHELAVRDAAVTTVALCCQPGEGEDLWSSGPEILD